MRLLLPALLLISLSAFARKKQNIVFAFENKVDSLVMYADSLLSSETSMGKMEANNNYKRILKEVLNDSTSIFYDFSRVENLAVVTESNNTFRIYSWTLRLGNDDYDYFGFTQYQRKRQKGFLSKTKIENYVYELNNSKSTIGDDYQAKLDTNNWWGCVYYNIVPSPKKKDKTFILLGWDGNSYRSTKKIIETVKFNNKGVPTFGHKVLRYDMNHGTKKTPKFETRARIIFEYSGKVSMSLNYNNYLQMIVFDHLSPSNPALAALLFTYAPDFTYDALVYEKRKWIYTRDIDVRNREDVKAEKWDPKNLKGRTIDTIIPVRN